MKRFARLSRGAEDEAELDAAAEEVADLITRAKALRDRSDALDPLSASKVESLVNKYEDRAMALTKRYVTELGRLAQLQRSSAFLNHPIDMRQYDFMEVMKDVRFDGK